MTYRKIAQIRNPEDFCRYLEQIRVNLPFDSVLESGSHSPLAQTYQLSDGFTIGNRFCTQPMEGWDGSEDGRPTALTFRRWQHFGQSGAKLIWGGEAVAVRHDGRANPNQLLINEKNLPEITSLRQVLVEAHERRFGSSTDLLVGLQLTHSGRFSRPNRKDRLEPVIMYHHPYLDSKFGISPDYPVISDREIEALITSFIQAAELAQAAGFHFVDIKHCHGYLAHEMLSAISRPGDFGGILENRTRFLFQVVRGIRERCPGLRIGVRLSAFDTVPFEPDAVSHVGQPVIHKSISFAFGASTLDPLSYDLTEPKQLLQMLQQEGIQLINITAGSPYYNPHIQRPAYFPPSDGYLPPEDPLAGVARQIQATAELKAAFPKLCLVGSAYSYLQEWLPYVGQHLVKTGKVDFIGLGRMILSYPDLPADLLAEKSLDRKRICRTFSDCTTSPRLGLVSGCYPLDEFYKSLPEANQLARYKAKRQK
jgi:2,4-dienoyl-CoA reductase-like NADH-dependent reductase (Old Yellow Enzyme family)